MKMYTKSDCKFVDGYIVYDKELVGVSSWIVNRLNDLETALQQAEYFKDQPAGGAGPSLDGFVRKSDRSRVAFEIPETPLFDAQVENAMKIIEEIRARDEAESVSKAMDNYGEMFDFVSSDFIIDAPPDRPIPPRFDCPTIGNPLELTAERLLGYLKALAATDMPV